MFVSLCFFIVLLFSYDTMTLYKITVYGWNQVLKKLLTLINIGRIRLGRSLRPKLNLYLPIAIRYLVYEILIFCGKCNKGKIS